MMDASKSTLGKYTEMIMGPLHGKDLDGVKLEGADYNRLYERVAKALGEMRLEDARRAHETCQGAIKIIQGEHAEELARARAAIAERDQRIATLEASMTHQTAVEQSREIAALRRKLEDVHKVPRGYFDASAYVQRFVTVPDGAFVRWKDLERILAAEPEKEVS